MEEWLRWASRGASSQYEISLDSTVAHYGSLKVNKKRIASIILYEQFVAVKTINLKFCDMLRSIRFVHQR